MRHSFSCIDAPEMSFARFVAVVTNVNCTLPNVGFTLHDFINKVFCNVFFFFNPRVQDYSQVCLPASELNTFTGCHCHGGRKPSTGVKGERSQRKGQGHQVTWQHLQLRLGLQLVHTQHTHYGQIIQMQPLRSRCRSRSEFKVQFSIARVTAEVQSQ